VRKVAVTASASGNGKTTVGRELARRLDVRETLRGAFLGREALIPYALRLHVSRRRRYPRELARYRVVRLRSQAEVEAFIERAAP
jgi:hypothetical protein